MLLPLEFWPPTVASMYARLTAYVPACFVLLLQMTGHLRAVRAAAPADGPARVHHGGCALRPGQARDAGHSAQRAGAGGDHSAGAGAGVRGHMEESLLVGPLSRGDGPAGVGAWAWGLRECLLMPYVAERVGRIRGMQPWSAVTQGCTAYASGRALTGLQIELI